MIFFFYFHIKIWAWKILLPREKSRDTTWGTSPNIPLKFKLRTKKQHKPKQANKQK